MSKIEWTDITINPIVGCTKISEGCQYCYAEKMAYRLKCMGISKYQDVVDKNGWTGKIGVDFSETFNKLPKKPKKIFVSSMGDLFHENVKHDWIRRVLVETIAYPQHIYILLTKRPERMKHIVVGYEDVLQPNLWLGVTAENQKRADERIPILLQIPAAVRFVSVEPMLGPVDLTNLNIQNITKIDSLNGDHGIYKPMWFNGQKLDQVICGPETGPKARPCKPKWIEGLYEQCKSAGVPFFDKRKTGWLAREFPK